MIIIIIIIFIIPIIKVIITIPIILIIIIIIFTSCLANFLFFLRFGRVFKCIIWKMALIMKMGGKINVIMMMENRCREE